MTVRSALAGTSPPLSCRSCRHFEDSAPAIEGALPGLSSLSSAYAAVRAGDGLCVIHERYIAAARVCDRHEARPENSLYAAA